MTMTATVSARFRHSPDCIGSSRKNIQDHAAELRVAQALRKAGIREHGADCLKREGEKNKMEYHERRP